MSHCSQECCRLRTSADSGGCTRVEASPCWLPPEHRCRRTLNVCACSGVLCDAQARRQPQPHAHAPCSRTRQAISPPLWRDERGLRLLGCRRAAMRARGAQLGGSTVRMRSRFSRELRATHLRARIDAAACRRGVALVALRRKRREAREVSGGEARQAAEVSRRLQPTLLWWPRLFWPLAFWSKRPR